MKVAVRYYSRSGNTEKVAMAIGKAVGEPSYTTDVPLSEDVDVLFLGSAVYAFGIDDEVKKFISGIDVKVGKVVNFSTTALVKSSYKHVKKALDAKGITLAKEEFHCRGRFGNAHKDRPNEKDLAEAFEFAKRILNG